MKIYIKSEFYIGLMMILAAADATIKLIKGEGDTGLYGAVMIGTLAMVLAFVLDSTSRIPIFSLGSKFSSDDVYEKSGRIIKKLTLMFVKIAFYGGIGLTLIGTFGIAKTENVSFMSFALTGGPIALLAAAECRFLVSRYIPKKYHV